MSSDRPFLSDGGDWVGDVFVGKSVDLCRFRLTLSLVMIPINPSIVLENVSAILDDDDVLGGLGCVSCGDEVGADCCAVSVVFVGGFFGVVGHSLVSCVVLQHLKHPNLGIGVTWLYSLSVIAHMLSSLSVCSYEIASSRACVPGRFKWFFSS